MPFDLYAWKTPRDLDREAAAALVRDWEAAGSDPSAGPFEPTTDVGWFHRELLGDHPGLDVTSDAVPSHSSRPVWLETEDEPPARLVAIRLGPGVPERDVLASIYGLAAKYDLVIFEARTGRVRQPLEEMAAEASATFWPRGAVQAGLAGGGGGLVAIVAWFLGIPIVSGLLVLVGGFMFVMAIWTFVHEGRVRLAARRGGPPAT